MMKIKADQNFQEIFYLAHNLDRNHNHSYRDCNWHSMHPTEHVCSHHNLGDWMTLTPGNACIHHNLYVTNSIFINNND